ncbi:hypothetical protein [Flavobacterium aquiphilum]|uniref:hypothetical protein n=1 Tax=Flavobacterium aquiphilum TaxID=3003261 RepID=UPI002480462D|nr:hypothetical protein [Flavobacterium aquiphilum]
MKSLQKILDKCKCSVTLTINQHRDYYETVETSIEEDERKDINPKVFAEMIKRDTVIELQFYPETPIGFFRIYHYDLKSAIELAISVLHKNGL